ncbi:ficolin-2-like [Musca vetustissima]|uniref:ficolin-2-like n=1 Tax=Musca vetustissima TaxID=27455 RepID=UPI002AB77208|nr:ficolin-2-like [Musca vetustissima]
MCSEDNVGNGHADGETLKHINDVDDIKDSTENMQSRHAQGPYSSCAEITACTQRSGYYYIYIPKFSNESFLVECDAHTEGGDWTVIQRREDGSCDFYRSWNEYKMGFGEVDGEFFIGLDKLFALTNYQGPQELLILMVNGTNEAKGYAKYASFKIANEEDNYKLIRTGQYTGTAGDSLRSHVGMEFTTKDEDNDLYEEKNCAVSYKGAWWYRQCHLSNLNGHYGDKSFGKGVNWSSFSGYYNSLTYVKMMIRHVIDNNSL